MICNNISSLKWVFIYFISICSLQHASYNQSIATLWVRLMCLIVGHLPFEMILITASLSSAMMKRTLLLTEGASAAVSRSPSTFIFLLSLWGNKSKMYSQKINIGRPSFRNATSSDTVYASADECDTTLCFLHIAEMVAKEFGPTSAMTAPEVDLLSL